MYYETRADKYYSWTKNEVKTSVPAYCIQFNDSFSHILQCPNIHILYLGIFRSHEIKLGLIRFMDYKYCNKLDKHCATALDFTGEWDTEQRVTHLCVWRTERLTRGSALESEQAETYTSVTALMCGCSAQWTHENCTPKGAGKNNCGEWICRHSSPRGEETHTHLSFTRRKFDCGFRRLSPTLSWNAGGFHWERVNIGHRSVSACKR